MSSLLSRLEHFLSGQQRPQFHPDNFSVHMAVTGDLHLGVYVNWLDVRWDLWR